MYDCDNYISKEYKALQEQFHKDRPDYGSFSHRYGPIVSKIVDKLNIENILDYGAGKCTLAEALICDKGVRVWPYDPCIPELSDPPTPTEMVVCTDVLEHIEPEYLDNVLNHLRELTQKVIFLAIHTGPAAKTLPDGRNAHLIQEDYRWWLPKVWDRFDAQTVTIHDSCTNVIAYPRTTNGSGDVC